mmetsp:Transcript_127107/g.283329  ORF Transcript_127107/g.283329 Transcript_127107/m.283329 type:complete len:301 (-) Transcript_127107:42-944(-)
MATATSEEVRQLRLQVDKLKERLDFMAPMLSLLNFTQDYFQRVECEASVQLMRLKNAHVPVNVEAAASAAGAEEASSEEKMAPHSVETAKWLHIMTDLIMILHGNAPSSTRESSTRGAEETSATRSVGGRSRTTSEASYSHGVAGHSPEPRLAPESCDGGLIELSLGGLPPRSRQDNSVLLARRTRDVAPVVPMETTLEFGGLNLGRGTWANAYRQATGSRRNALRLLCTSGIVTERELSDDLTVISEEHVEECISIAEEMLQKWPPARGPPPQREAKSFFEERLAMLYMRRAPEPFGKH